MYLGRQVEDNMTDMNVVRRMTKKIKAKQNKQTILYVLVMSRTRFQSESTLYSCLNVKELLARSRRKI